MTDEVLNAWGDSVPDAEPGDPYWVPPEERTNSDEGEGSNALGVDRNGDDTGDDLDGWKPGDPINDPLDPGGEE